MNTTNKPTYNATASRENGWWIIRFQEFDAITQAKTLSEIHERTATLPAAWFDINDDSYDVNLEIKIPEAALARWEASRAKQRHAAAESAEAAALAREAVQTLRQEGVTVKDVGELLGVSRQRIQQLEKASA